MLESWLTNDADLGELTAFLAGSRSIHSAVVSRAAQHGLTVGAHGNALAAAVAAEQQAHRAVAVFIEAELGETDVDHNRETLPHLDCPIVASGSVAGLWACQVVLAAATERAMLRLGLRRELLELKQRHSACSARCLVEWSRAAQTAALSGDGQRVPPALAAGFDRVVERYCALFGDTVGMLQNCA